MDNQICIMITEGKYKDEKTILDDGLYKIIWEGQQNIHKYDNHIDKGTHVFWRKKRSVPFTYLGKVINKELINERTENNPIKLKLIVADYECDYKNYLCNKIRDECYKYQNACWRSINLKPIKCNGHGIYVKNYKR
jgi:hypothetical protein